MEAWTDSLIYAIVAVPAVGVWATGLLLGAGVTPFSLGLVLVIEHVRRNRRSRLTAASDTVSSEAPDGLRRLERRDLLNWLGIALGVMPLAMLVAISAVQWYWVWALFGVSTVLAVKWWQRLRREKVRHAEVYAIAGWLLPRVVWGVFVLVNAVLNEGDIYWFFNQEPDVEAKVFGGTLVLAAALAYTVAVALMAVRFAVSEVRRVDPLRVMALAVPAIVLFWFVEPFGFAHLGFTTMLVGYGISSEMGRRWFEGVEQRRAMATRMVVAVTGTDRFRNAGPGIATVVIAAAVASGLVVALWEFTTVSTTDAVVASWVVLVAVAVVAVGVNSRTGSGAGRLIVPAMAVIAAVAIVALRWYVPYLFEDAVGRDVAATEGYVLTQIVSVNAVWLCGLVVVMAFGMGSRYGAVCLGSGSLLLYAFAYNIPTSGFSSPSWAFEQWFSATLSFSGIVWAMWRVFGPGADADGGREGSPSAVAAS